jgi:hypothetical protein
VDVVRSPYWSGRSATRQRAFRRRDLEEILLPLFEVPAERWPEYLDACDRSRQRGWWHDYDDEVIPEWFRHYLGLEDGASTLRGFAMQVVPGLLQSRAYARVITAEADTPEDAADLLDIRMRRQRLLVREPDPLQVHYVLDEAVLRRRVGSAEIMRQQLDHLVELAERPNVTLQVLPFDRGYYFDGKSEPDILGFPWDDDPGVVLVQGQGDDGRCLDEPAQVQDYEVAFEKVERLALTPVESPELLRRIAQDHQP